MDILFINRNIKAGFSFAKVFNPIIERIAETNTVNVIEAPEYRGLPWHSLHNIIYVFRHRNKHGINHVTGLDELALGVWHKRTIVTFHDTNFMLLTKNPISRFIKFILRLYLPILAADCITCISEKTKKELERYTKKKIHVVYNPLDPTYIFSPKDFNESRPTILHVGTGWNKNLKNTIMALKDIKCHLRIIGEINEDTRQLLNQCRIDYSNISNISDRQMLREYKQCDIVNFPSIYEGFGMPIIEGQATGRPVITSRIEPMTEVAGDAAIFVNPKSINELHESYKRIICDKHLREQLITRGLNNVHRFDLDKICSEYLKLYESL